MGKRSATAELEVIPVPLSREELIQSVLDKIDNPPAGMSADQVRDRVLAEMWANTAQLADVLEQMQGMSPKELIKTLMHRAG